MTRIEKGVIGTIILTVALLVVMVVGLTTAVHEAGGVRQLIVDTGKEVKSIYDEINDEQSRI
jgi:hypothetical protein